MDIAIIVSLVDPAGMNIKKNLISLGFTETKDLFEDTCVFSYKGNSSVRLYTAKKESIYNEDIDKLIDADLFIFATKHKSASGIPSLCVHVQGNWGRAEHGGKDRELCTAPAGYLRKAFLILAEAAAAAGLDHEVMQEATHHGPYLEKPSMFIEIGSDEARWTDPASGRIIAEALVNLIDNLPEAADRTKVALGIGGLHHTPLFRKLVLEKGIALGHICPKYALSDLDEGMILQAIEKNMEGKAGLVILDWKGMGKEKQRIVEILRNMGIAYKKTTDF